jgi:hypothetical protein
VWRRPVFVGPRPLGAIDEKGLGHRNVDRLLRALQCYVFYFRATMHGVRNRLVSIPAFLMGCSNVNSLWSGSRIVFLVGWLRIVRICG